MVTQNNNLKASYNHWNSRDIATLIYDKISNQKDDLKAVFNSSKQQIGYFYIDNLLPDDIAMACYLHFPSKDHMTCLNSVREYKYVSAQMNKHHKLLERVLYAFQDKKVVALISEICGVKDLYADKSLYAGGLSLMTEGNFLNPHLDNSHDAQRERWRVLNLLYYVTPDWELQDGGHLELWPNGPKQSPICIESKFNRLAVMATHATSWHSVSKVVSKTAVRRCISNYYFSTNPLHKSDTFHVTKYRGRPEEKLKDIVLTLDGNLRMLVRKFFKEGIRKNPHVYKAKEDK